jgi:preprotein translocase subunit YajC
LTAARGKVWSAANSGKQEPIIMWNLLIPPAYAQTAAGTNPLLTNVVQFAPLVLIFAVFYFLLIRPQQQRQRELRQALASLKRGDRVVTGGGIVGKVQKLREGSNEIEVEIAPNVTVTVLRETITAVLKPSPANDAKPPAKAAGG